VSSFATFPNYNLFLDTVWGWSTEFGSSLLAGASNVVVGTNPPYSITDFLAVYPKFGGAQLAVQGAITVGSAVVTGIQTTAGILPGQPVAPVTVQGGTLVAGNFPDGTLVLSVDSATQITLSQPATTNTIPVIGIYTQPFVPFTVIALFINLASASLVQARWQEWWPMGMAWFIAHFCTLWMRTDGSPTTSAGQAVSQGLARGIMISKSAGGVSASMLPVTQGGGLEGWGSWQETEYGVQFATIARMMGAGPLWVY